MAKASANGLTLERELANRRGILKRPLHSFAHQWRSQRRSRAFSASQWGRLIVEDLRAEGGTRASQLVASLRGARRRRLGSIRPTIFAIRCRATTRGHAQNHSSAPPPRITSAIMPFATRDRYYFRYLSRRGYRAPDRVLRQEWSGSPPTDRCLAIGWSPSGTVIGSNATAIVTMERLASLSANESSRQRQPDARQVRRGRRSIRDRAIAWAEAGWGLLAEAFAVLPGRLDLLDAAPARRSIRRQTSVTSPPAEHSPQRSPERGCNYCSGHWYRVRRRSRFRRCAVSSGGAHGPGVLPT